MRERINFGSGTGFGQHNGIFVDADVLKHWSNGECPYDGNYAIVPKLKGSCFPVDGGPAWHDVNQDHTGNSDGYMVNINSTKSTNRYFQKRFDNLCKDSVYTFEIFVMNIKRDSTRGVAPRPNIKVLKTDLTVLFETSFVDLKVTASPTWVRRQLTFSSSSNTSIIVQLVDLGNSNVQNGGDYVLDDVALIGSRSIIPPEDTFTDVDTNYTQQDTTIEPNPNPEPQPPLENKTFVPNAFSPNGDGINDTWDLSALNLYTSTTITVFNRFGKAVYKDSGSPANWDGTSNGSSLPVGVYYYLIDIPEEEKKLSGWLLLAQ